MGLSSELERAFEGAESSRRERKKFETEQRLIKAAIELMQEKGVFDTTVEEITSRADVGKGTFFNYFPSKEAVIASVFLAKREQVAMAAEIMRKADDAKSALKRFMLFAVNEPKRTPKIVQSIYSTALTNPAVREPFCALIMEGRRAIQAGIERGQRLGQVRRDLKAEEMARFLQQVIFGTQGIWAMSDPAEDLEQRVSAAFEIYWRGIAAESVTADKRRSKA